MKRPMKLPSRHYPYPNPVIKSSMIMRRLAQFVRLRLRASASVSRLASRVCLASASVSRLVSRLCASVSLLASVSRLRLRASACVCVCLASRFSRLSRVCVCLASCLASVCVCLASRICLASRVPNARVCVRLARLASVCPCECLRGTGSFYASVVIQRV